MVNPTDPLRRALGEVVARGDFQVPPYPAVALRLQRLLAQPNYGIAEVADAIAADPALATRVLSVANSALYRAAEEITTLPRAVNRLGARVVAQVAFAAGVGASATQDGTLFDVKYRVWRRSVTCALGCQKLAPLRNLDPNEAFVVALIHGFGRSVATASLEELLKSHRLAKPLSLADWLGIAEAERGPLAFAVATQWQLPKEIVKVLDPAAGETPLGTLVGDAERMALALESGARPEAAAPREQAALDELVLGLPAALDALASVPPPVPGRPASAVAKAEQALTGERRPFGLAVEDTKKHGAAKLAASAITPTGLVMTSSVALQEASVVRLAFGQAAERFDAWFNVLLSAPSAGSCRVEVELFSPKREIKERWQQLFDAAAPAAGGPTSRRT
jgi:HD-like signal output (HDOD) protein